MAAENLRPEDPRVEFLIGVKSSGRGSCGTSTVLYTQRFNRRRRGDDNSPAEFYGRHRQSPFLGSQEFIVPALSCTDQGGGRIADSLCQAEPTARGVRYGQASRFSEWWEALKMI